ncbi:MAG: hypothetical protein COV67_13085 [Nitrospinae bacterium CG11_big_fil_rev_8_21_14_0_20_56_8]|nr:MAG: hypothetical protein COV67_13085 [Nitrospinae bacterium CG11_big_fil_rev_8_21_14_0_20_56_8]
MDNTEKNKKDGKGRLPWWKRLGRWWAETPEAEQRRLKSFLPLIAYTIAFVYFVIWKSILDTQYRNRTSSAVIQNWFGNDDPATIAMIEQKKAMDESFKELRKRVAGGR